MRLLLLLLAVSATAQEPSGVVEKLAPYYPTPETIVDKMLEMGGLRAGEKMYDLGSGDGRIVILAARKYHASAIGVEYDKDLVHQSDAKIRKLSLQGSAKIIHGDIFAQNYGSADLITVYLLPSSNDKVRPMLERQLKKGARVVAHDFEFSGWTPTKTETIDDDGEGRSHTLFLYQR